MEDFDYDVLVDTIKESIVLSEYSYHLYEELIKKYPKVIKQTTIHCNNPSYISFSTKDEKCNIRIFRRAVTLVRKDVINKVIDFISFREYKKDMTNTENDFLLKSLFKFYEEERR
jgi:hypothetical protein